MGAHRETRCPQCPQAFIGPKSLVALDMREHFIEEHSPKPEPVRRSHCDEVGHYCKEVQAITPVVNGFCGHCRSRVKAKYEWFEPEGLRAFWRPIATAA